MYAKLSSQKDKFKLATCLQTHKFDKYWPGLRWNCVKTVVDWCSVVISITKLNRFNMRHVIVDTGNGVSEHVMIHACEGKIVYCSTHTHESQHSHYVVGSQRYPAALCKNFMQKYDQFVMNATAMTAVPYQGIV